MAMTGQLQWVHSAPFVFTFPSATAAAAPSSSSSAASAGGAASTSSISSALSLQMVEEWGSATLGSGFYGPADPKNAAAGVGGAGGRGAIAGLGGKAGAKNTQGQRQLLSLSLSLFSLAAAVAPCAAD